MNSNRSTLARLGNRVRLSAAWAAHDAGYRLQGVAQRLSGSRTPGTSPLYLGALLELTEAADVSIADLFERAERGSYFPGLEGAR